MAYISDLSYVESDPNNPTYPDWMLGDNGELIEGLSGITVKIGEGNGLYDYLVANYAGYITGLTKSVLESPVAVYGSLPVFYFQLEVYTFLQIISAIRMRRRANPEDLTPDQQAELRIKTKLIARAIFDFYKKDGGFDGFTLTRCMAMGSEDRELADYWRLDLKPKSLSQ